jgi:hypothetical protein
MSDVNGQKNARKNFIVNGQDVIDFMLGDLGLGFSADKIVGTLEIKVDSDCFTYIEDKENLGKDWNIEVDGWNITIEQRYERGIQNQMLDEDDVFCGLVESEKITFSGDGNYFRKWLEKNWKEVHESYSWRLEQ